MQMTRLQNKQVMNEISFLINRLRFIKIFVFYLIPKIKKKNCLIKIIRNINKFYEHIVMKMIVIILNMIFLIVLKQGCESVCPLVHIFLMFIFEGSY